MSGFRLSIFLFVLFCFSLQAQKQGKATYYSPKLKGNKTSDGSRYHPDSLTCAHRTYPLGTYLLVTNPKNNQKVVVKVTDRGPFHKKLMIDLSYSAAKSLDIIRQGIALVEVCELDFIPQALNLIPTPSAKVKCDEPGLLETLSKKFFSDDLEPAKSPKK